MNICRHCGVAIAEFEFTEGKVWWHFCARPYLYCRGLGKEEVASP